MTRIVNIENFHGKMIFLPNFQKKSCNGSRQLMQSSITPTLMPKRTEALITKVSAKQFPALEGQSVSTAILGFAPKAVNPPHTHPRGAELLLVIAGELEVGFVDTNNKLFTQTLRSQDLFIFPKGLVHYQVNKGGEVAVAVGMFGSASAGTVAIGEAVFASGIAADVLAEGFKTDASSVAAIVSGFKK